MFEDDLGGNYQWGFVILGEGLFVCLSLCLAGNIYIVHQSKIKITFFARNSTYSSMWASKWPTFMHQKNLVLFEILSSY